MADYKAIKGWTIQKVSSDPDNPILGQVWYNSTLGAVRVAKTQTGSWSTGGNLNSTKKGLAGGGTQTAAILAGGTKPPGNADTDESEEYDGSSWTEGNNLNTGRGWIDCGGGTQTAGWIAGGQDGDPPPHPLYDNNEHYNGTSWSEEADMNEAKNYRCGNGTQTASVAAGGGPDGTVNSEEFDGSSWTEGNNLNSPGTSRTGLKAGLQTAALCLAGHDGSAHMEEVESYDGTSWTEITDLNTARDHVRAMGTQTLANAAGGGVPGSPGVSALNEQWDGTSWTEVADLSNARKEGGGAGTNAAGLVAGGEKPAISQDTEEWTGDSVTAASADVT